MVTTSVKVSKVYETLESSKPSVLQVVDQLLVQNHP